LLTKTFENIVWKNFDTNEKKAENAQEEKNKSE